VCSKYKFYKDRCGKSLNWGGAFLGVNPQESCWNDVWDFFLSKTLLSNCTFKMRSSSNLKSELCGQLHLYRRRRMCYLLAR